MFIEIINLVLSVVVGIVAGACLLRCYMQWFGSQLGAEQRKLIGVYLFSLTNWIVIPLRRVIPSIGRLDTASLLAAYLLVLGKVVILSLLIAGSINIFSLLTTLFDLIDLTLSGLIGLVFIYVILSWLSAGSQTQYIVSLNEAAAWAHSTNDSEARSAGSIAAHPLARFANSTNCD
jgi:YggT family protein